MMIDTTQQQLELAIHGGAAPVLPARVRKSRLVRAQWWFAKMRRTVEQALEWSPSPQPRPEQIWFSDRMAGSAK
jgi:hypothetical protein